MRFWYFLRELVWSAVTSIALLISAVIVSLVTDNYALAIVLGLGSVAWASLAQREL